LNALHAIVENTPRAWTFGTVTAVQGLMIEASCAPGAVSIGSRLTIRTPSGPGVRCEAAGFRHGRAVCLAFDPIDGVRLGARVDPEPAAPSVRPSRRWLGRVINAFGEPVDGKGPLGEGHEPYVLRAAPPPAHTRTRVGAKLDLGVRALNVFASACRGQRLGVFAGSGVGKSVLLSMLARNTNCDVAVIGLIGERGREVQEFIEDDLGPEGLKRSVVIVATSDEASLLRRQAAYLTMATAEYFRDTGAQVLCLMDSVTRFAMAQREIGLACGEPPATKGYTPSVFAELPKLLERAGPGAAGQGAITGLFTVLVEGDDHNEPVADAVRGILDGHIVMERAIAERGRYPAINVLKSLSRTMPGCNSAEENQIVGEARRALSLYENMAELIRLGAYKPGSDPETDAAIRLYPHIEAFLRQGKAEKTNLGDGYRTLAKIMSQGRQG
jgi:flagellum-specific ATP synthase